MRKLSLLVDARSDGATLRNFLRAKGYSARSLTRLKYYGEMLINGGPAKTGIPVREGDEITLVFAEDEKLPTPERLNVRCLYEDEDIIAFDKPAFMAVHPAKKIQSGTLANAFAAHMEKTGQGAAFRPINRLDVGTSGIVVAAKHPHAAAMLAGRIDKEYLCVCHGRLPDSGEFDGPIRMCADSKIKREVGEGGRSALTRFMTVKTDGRLSVARVKLGTGRTHQIRVHFSSAGHPLVGDTLYGVADADIARQALHCCRVWLDHPIGGERLELSSELPEDIQKIVDNIDIG